MFRKLVSNLPFQPSSLSDIATYVKLLRSEQRLRAYGLVLLTLGMLLQLFIVILPPKATLTTHRNDIIYGATTKNDIISAYRSGRDQMGRSDIKAIYGAYGISESQIERSEITSLTDSTDHLTIVSRGGNEAARYIPVNGLVNGVYEYPLSKWNNSAHAVYATYPALTGISANGLRFWILLNGSGNIVFENNAIQTNLSLLHTRESSSVTASNQDITYTILYKNSGTVAARNTTIFSELPKGVTYVGYGSVDALLFEQDGNRLSWQLANANSTLVPTNQWRMISLKLRPDSNTTGSICANSSIHATNASRKDAKDKECVQIMEQTCPGTGQPIPATGIADCSVPCPDGSMSSFGGACANPQLSCQDLSISYGTDPKERTLSTKVIAQQNANVKAVQYYVNNQKVATIPTSDDNPAYNVTYPFNESGVYNVKSEVIPENGEVPAGQNCSVNATIVIHTNKDPIIIQSLAARHTKTHASDSADINAGDTITYAVSLSNKGSHNESVSMDGDFAFDVSDILEYATITSLDGGTLDNNVAKITWPAVDVTANETITKQVVVSVNKPLSATPTSSSNPLSYDNVIAATYGNTVSNALKQPVTKRVESINRFLPANHSLYATVIIILLCSAGLFFYVRTRLLVKELSLIEHEFKTGGL